MTTDGADDATDLIRWTFTVDPDAAEAVESHLADLGADVFVRDGGSFHVTWDEPEVDLDPVVEAVWELAGEHFEITQEEFHRLALHVLQHEPGDGDGDDDDDDDDEDGSALETESGAEAGEAEAFHPAVEPLEIKEL